MYATHTPNAPVYTLYAPIYNLFTQGAASHRTSGSVQRHQDQDPPRGLTGGWGGADEGGDEGTSKSYV